MTVAQRPTVAAGPLRLPLPAGPPLVAHRRAREQLMAGHESEFAALRRLDPLRRAVELGSFGGLFVLGLTLSVAGHGAALSLWRWPALLLGIGLTAVAINAFILLLHEGMHDTLFGHPALNRWVSVLLGSTFLLSFTAYRVMHQRHHRYLGDPRDPDDYHNYTANRHLIWLLHYFRLILGVYVYLVLIPVFAFRHGTSSQRRQILTDYAVLGTLYTTLFITVSGSTLLVVWILPLILAAHATAVRGLTQHGITDAQDPFLASRSIQAGPVVAFCLLHENYHLEHHLFPEVPSYHLSRLHRLVWPRLPHVVTGRSYLGFLWSFLKATRTLSETPIGLTDMPGWDV
jgi:fatty acid desaturase